MQHKIRLVFLTLFYSGLSPKAPGTIGSILALILGMLALEVLHISNIFMIVILVTIIGIQQINLYEQDIGVHDGKEIVIDEFVGMWLALSIAGVQAGMWIMGIIAFIYFRIFDIWKPSLIGKIDRDVKGGLGVMGDDLLAGFFAGICTSMTYYLLF
ncbi:Phosphatidylglycerophosphatase A [hydrothermal vent metagenome]|uniref:Phosphatidylglycerophosphatase A n=1 Tax=hydrothermal vent metagenome TaxID=652676 RepID=A0A3B1DY31_9ZZZZ